MPELDVALLCDYVRAENGIAHVIAAGIDTITTPEVPSGRSLGLLARFTFQRSECARPHRIEFIFMDTDGTRLTQGQLDIEPQWNEDLPPGWPTGALLGLNLGVPLPSWGAYACDILVNDTLKKTITFRVVPPPQM